MKLPLHFAHTRAIEAWRQEIISILQGSDERLLVIVGPCSIHNVESALEYAERLQKLHDSLKDHLFIIMRVYVEKPRSFYGWKGLLYDPDLDGSSDIAKGLFLTRSLLFRLMEMGIPAATEFVDPLATPYIEDLISWGSIGARTTASQVHRQMASALPMPIGIKNTIDGNIEAAVAAVHVAKQSHMFLSIDRDGKVSKKEGRGNSFPHIVLRGGRAKSNYDRESIQGAAALLRQAALPQKLIIDCSHDNCGKDFLSQKKIFTSIATAREEDAAIREVVRGMMIESFLLAGSHASHKDQATSSPYAHASLSMTDSCLGWEETEELLNQIYHLSMRSL